jgi:hypothetical protein
LHWLNYPSLPITFPCFKSPNQNAVEKTILKELKSNSKNYCNAFQKVSILFCVIWKFDMLCHLQQVMYKAVQSNLYIKDTKGKTIGPVSEKYCSLSAQSFSFTQKTNNSNVVFHAKLKLWPSKIKVETDWRSLLYQPVEVLKYILVRPKKKNVCLRFRIYLIALRSEGVIIPQKNCCGRIIKKLIPIIFQDVTGNSFLGQRK